MSQNVKGKTLTFAHDHNVAASLQVGAGTLPTVELQLQCWKPKLKPSKQPHCAVDLGTPIPR